MCPREPNSTDPNEMLRKYASFSNPCCFTLRQWSKNRIWKQTNWRKFAIYPSNEAFNNGLIITCIVKKNMTRIAATRAFWIHFFSLRIRRRHTPFIFTGREKQDRPFGCGFFTRLKTNFFVLLWFFLFCFFTCHYLM